MPAHLWSLPQRLAEDFNVAESTVEVFHGDEVVVHGHRMRARRIDREEVTEWLAERGYVPDGESVATWTEEWFYTVESEASG